MKIKSLLTCLLLFPQMIIFSVVLVDPVVASTSFDSSAIVKTKSFEVTDWNSCAIDEHKTLKCWGDNSSGQLNVPADLGPVTQIAGGGEGQDAFFCAITVAQVLRCWGTSAYGVTHVPSDLGPVLTASAGGFQVCAVVLTGEVKCWGRNNNGQTSVPTDLGTVKQIAVAQWQTCAITSQDYARCWGHGNGNQTDVPSDLGKVTRIAPGSEHTCVLTFTNAMRCWGTWYSSAPAQAPENLGSVPQISSGSWNTCVLTQAGVPRCFGYNMNGINVPLSNLPPLSDIKAAWIHSCASTNNFELICWGSNRFGESTVPTDLGRLYSGELESGPTLMPGTDHYYLINDRPLNWDQARAYATSLKFKGVSGHLANVTSASENQFVSNLLRNSRENPDDAWIGAKANLRHDFYFADGEEAGEPVSYSNWDSGEPNNYDHHEFYAVLKTNSTWNDYCDCRGLWSIVEFYIPFKAPVPVVSGEFTSGSTLSVAAGISDQEASAKYQWMRNGVAIAGANGSTYVLSKIDLYQKVSVIVTANKTGFNSLATQTPQTTVVKSADLMTSLSITGKRQVGAVLSAKPNKIMSKFDYTYTWFISDKPTENTSSSKRQVIPADSGSQIGIQICSWYLGNKVQCLSKKDDSLVELGILSNTRVVIGGVSKPGRIVRAVVPTADNQVSVKYQWLLNGLPIEHQITDIYVIQGSDLGQQIGVQVTFDKSGYLSKTVTAPSRLVQK
ncbi:MAG: hypothetical protein EBZ61_08130 [Micrococcales bacterium]|nr:hypothetical protein [Micrococcales bacterium]